MRNYIIGWDSEKNVITFEPTKNNEGKKAFNLSKKDIVTYILDFGETEVSTTLDGCLEYISENMTKEDFITLSSFLYSWGQYNGARLN